MNKSQFSVWLEHNTELKQASITKYSQAILTISSEMMARGVISKDLYSMNCNEIDLAIFNILRDQTFVSKDLTGNKMYSNAMRHYRACLIDKGEDAFAILESVDEIETQRSLTKTTREQLVQARIGQGDFKKELMKKYDSRCIITGISESRVLIASHIKPWAVSTNYERLDVSNGLLLSATYDKLFDKGIISFKENGTLLVSRTLSRANCALLKLSSGVQYPIKANQALKHYLEYHRDVLFLK